MKIQCKTYFDCSPTGVTGHYRVSSIPFRDRVGKTIESQAQWNYSRNQQRNWETLNQLISLRTQPENITPARELQGIWTFEFEVEQPLVYSESGVVGDLTTLINECNGVPMITGLTESRTKINVLSTRGDDQNIWFSVLNSELE